MKNLFVVSNFGQIHQCNRFIAKEGYEENYLAILYTTKNLEMPKLTEETANKDLFKGIERFELPVNCMKIRADSSRIMQANYRNLLLKHKPTDLYIFSFEGHYVILARLARKLGVRVHLVEEGTGTYKLAVPAYQEKSAVTWRKTLDQAYKKSKISKNPWIRALVHLLFLPRDLIDFSKKMYAEDRFQQSLLKFLPWRLSNGGGRFTQFDSLHVAFPAVLQPHFPKVKVQEYFVHEKKETSEEVVKLSDQDEIANQVIRKYNISESDVIFVSQRYPITLNVYTSHIIRLLEELVSKLPEENNRILIKLHPKEAEPVKVAYKKAAKHMGKKAALIDSPPFPIETLISLSKVKALAGIASSSLIYAAKVDQSLEIYSIGDKLAQELKKIPAERVGAEQIESHVSLLKLFPHIKHI